MSSHDERLASIRHYLEAFLKLREMSPGGAIGLTGACLQSEFLLERGEAFQGRAKPAEYGWDEVKLCFQNAAQLAISDSSLTYYEGYAIAAGGFPVHHAWVVDADGGVIDTTWRVHSDLAGPGEWTYFGAGFSTEFVCRVLVEKGTWGVLDSPLVYEAA